MIEFCSLDCFILFSAYYTVGVNLGRWVVSSKDAERVFTKSNIEKGTE